MNQSYEFSTRQLNQLELSYECLSIKVYSYCIDHFCHDACNIILRLYKDVLLACWQSVRCSDFLKLSSYYGIFYI